MTCSACTVRPWLVVFSAVAVGACSNEHAAPVPLSDGAARSDAVASSDGRDARMAEREPRVDLTGRWTSSGFEDSFEAEFQLWSSDELTGRVCGPDLGSEKLPLQGNNCGAVTAGWVLGHMVHFDFSLPWTTTFERIDYQFVGVASDDGRIAGFLKVGSNGESLITWTLCPVGTRWCPDPPNR